MEIAEFNCAVEAVQTKYDADIFLYNAPIGDEGFSHLAQAVAANNQNSQRPNCILILVTLGGQANSAYQIARLMQATYDKFFLFTPSICKSAGTIISLGAHEIIMDVFSELGPLDVQLLDKDEIGSRKSGLLSRSSFEALAHESFELFSHHMINIKLASGGLVSFKLAAELAAKIATDLMAPVFAQLNPDVIGSDHRDLSVASDYGVRLAGISKNPKDNAVGRLVKSYPSHDFIIDRDEASSLFNNVSEPTPELYKLVGCISQYTHKPMSTAAVFAVDIIEPEDEPDEDEGKENDKNPKEKTTDIKQLDEGSTSDRKSNKKSGKSG